jgi:virginiamycin B lyase
MGPDGNMWVAESGTGALGNGCFSPPALNVDRIARITPYGSATEFASGITNCSNPTEIVTGPDKNLWFTEPGADKIGMITTSGKVTEFPLTTGAKPQGITAGPVGSGTVWFTEQNSGLVGRITSGVGH